MKSPELEKSYRVHVYETGPNGKLSLYSLLNYMQDIASDHAEDLGYGRDDLMKNNRFWVLSRLYAEINEWPEWEDSVILRTWPNGTDGIFAMRNYEIIGHGGKVTGSGSSSWLILDTTTRRIQRPDAVLSRFAGVKPGYSPVRNPAKLDAAADGGKTSEIFTVRISDLDVNQHTNNTVYLKWACDTYGFDFLMKNVPQSAEINYLAESKHDEGIMIETSSENHNFFNHSIYRTADRKELCRIRLGWKEVIK